MGLLNFFLSHHWIKPMGACLKTLRTSWRFNQGRRFTAIT